MTGRCGWPPDPKPESAASGVASDIPGLSFIGLLWQHSQASATLFGPTIDAPHLAARMGLGFPQVPSRMAVMLIRELGQTDGATCVH